MGVSVANTTESFIDEVAEAVRRDKLAQWFRRWGWVIGVVVLAIVGTAAFLEWRESRQQAAAEFRGEAILTALETEAAPDRLAALSELPVAGSEGAVAAFLLAAEQSQSGDSAAAAQTLNALASDGEAPPLYRDLASLKALMLQGPEADPAALEALAAPGAPFGLLAREQLALLHLGADRRDEAIAVLEAIRQDAEVSPAQRGRIEGLMTALGVTLDPVEPATTEVPAPVGE